MLIIFIVVPPTATPPPPGPSGLAPFVVVVISGVNAMFYPLKSPSNRTLFRVLILTVFSILDGANPSSTPPA